MLLTDDLTHMELRLQAFSAIVLCAYHRMLELIPFPTSSHLQNPLTCKKIPSMSTHTQRQKEFYEIFLWIKHKCTEISSGIVYMLSSLLFKPSGSSRGRSSKFIQEISVTSQKVFFRLVFGLKT